MRNDSGNYIQRITQSDLNTKQRKASTNFNCHRSPSLYFTDPIYIFIVRGILNWPLLFLLSIPFRNEWELSLHWFLFSNNRDVQSLKSWNMVGSGKKKPSVNGAVSERKEWISNTHAVLLEFKIRRKFRGGKEEFGASTAIKIIVRTSPKRTEFSSET